MHTASSEAYVVLSGSGRLETLDSAGFSSTPLEPGVVAWFTPGTIHRAINDSGDLTVLVIMQNAGLPENGDAVMTFPPALLRSKEAYLEAATLAPRSADSVDPGAEAAARRRRDLAMEGYIRLKEATLLDGGAALSAFHAAAARLVADRTQDWSAYLEGGAELQTATTRGHLESLQAAESFFLGEAQTTIGTREPHRKYGMCGRIETWNVSDRGPDGSGGKG
jgi:Cupin domain